MSDLHASGRSNESQSAAAGTVTFDRAFHELLVLYPEALIAAIGDDGLIVPMPASVSSGRHRVVIGRSVIDMVVPADKKTVIATWERSRHEGGANAVIHLLANPDEPVVMTFVDARAEHGAHLAAFVPASGVDHHRLGHSTSFAVVPRIARVRKDELAVMTDVDAATSKILGWSREAMIGQRSLVFIHPDDQERAISNWMEMLTAPGHDQRVRLRHQAADGAWVWMEITNRNLLDDPEYGCVMTEMVDVTEELVAQEALRANEQLLRQLAEALPLGVVQVEADRSVSYVNERMAEITGVAPAATLDDQLHNVVAADLATVSSAIDRVLSDGRDQDIEVRFEGDPAVGTRLCTMSMRSLTSDDGAVTGAIICVSDVTERARMTAELERRATFDSLTGCHNRLSIMSILHQRLADPGAGLAVIFVDLDGFKGVNDTLGHLIGDGLLIETARRLQRSVRPQDVVGRVGGDEFLIVCSDVSTAAEARAVADRIDDALATGVAVFGAPIVVRASLGIAYTDVAATSSDRLVAEADAAMYAAKRARSADDPSAGADQLSVRRARLTDEAAALRAAILNDELEVHFQPVVTLPARDVCGLEALVRWRRHGEMVPAVAFINMAETTGLVVEMGAWVLEEVCRSASLLGLDVQTLNWYLNMSVKELAAPHATKRFQEALGRFGLSAQPFVIEVTEHSSLFESAAALEAVRELREMGAGIALDDFGTGYSSLAMLRSLPVTCIKLDRTFTADLGIETSAAHILEYSALLAQRMGITLVVEGVETERQAQHLALLGVERAQGYLFAPPRRLADVKLDSLQHR